MTDLKSLSTIELLHSTDKAVGAEKDAITNTTRHFQEVYAREAYLPKYPSMFEFLRKKYGYCNASAQMRIDAIKLISELPDVREKLETGELTMSAAANIQSFINSEKRSARPLSVAAQTELITNCLGKTKLEVQKEFGRLSHQADKADMIRVMAEAKGRVSVALTHKSHQNLQDILEAFSHVDPNMSLAQLIERLSEDGVKRYCPDRRSDAKSDFDVETEQMIAAKRSRYVPSKGAKHA